MSPQDAVRHAVANARLAGVELGAAWVKKLERVARNEMTVEELVDMVRRGWRYR